MTFTHNQPEYSVSEIAGHVKRMVEETFGYVRVRGEISRPNVNASSGHCYLTLKDDKAVLDAIIWKGTLSKLAHKPEVGMEVIATGRLTTYPGNSKYQLVIESLEPAGIGALMAMLEKRKRALEAEGLFSSERKKPLPFLPARIGIITSPTGAVIRDILHRLADRFPVEVLLWPVPVQGQGAAEKIAAAIAGMNALPQASDVAAGAVAPSPLAGEGWDGGVSDSSVLSPRPPTLPSPARREGSPAAPLSPITKPDLLIVARGGGSIEDLWAFNEEVVVRAAAASTIPLISAVGHETDTTLIDFAADMRAPTPTAAAEMAVPVRSELRSRLEQSAASNNAALRKMLQHHKERVEGLSRGLPRPQQLVATMAQTLDSLSERLQHALPQRLELLQQRVQQWAASLPRPEQLVALKTQALQGLMQRISAAAERQLAHRREGLMRASAGLRPRLLADRLKHAQQQLNHASAMLESLSVMNVLKRGFAMVREESGKLVTSAAAMPEQGSVQLQFHDGVRVVMAGNAAPIAAATPSKSRSKKPAPQPGLFDE